MIKPWKNLLLLTCLLGGCAAPSTIIQRNVELKTLPPGETLYVVPFVAIMVPQEIVTGIFDRVVDELNRSAAQGAPVVILKRDLSEVEPAWLASKYYLTGELFGYVRDSGCCSTELRLRTRVNYHQPGHEQPTLTVTCPRAQLFDHDASNIDAEQQKLIAEVSQSLVAELQQYLAPARP